MTAVYITIDTEYSVGLAARLGLGARGENFARSIACETSAGAVGIFHQMDVMERNGLRGVFFVDPMPALVWGLEAIRAVVEPIVVRGHDVQLHLHTEWLALAGRKNPLDGRTGQHLHCFGYEDQVTLIGLARDYLVAAGAPPPVAFRAGNYAADDNTLLALRHHGIRYDSSHVPGIANSDCRITLGARDHRVVRHQGAIEVPVGSIRSLRGLRHAQVTALSAWEMGAALRYAVKHHVPMLTIVTHSFELLSRDRSRINSIVRDRFEKFCETVAHTAGARGATFASRPPQIGDETGCAAMPLSEIRAAARIAEQFLANALYGSR